MTDSEKLATIIAMLRGNVENDAAQVAEFNRQIVATQAQAKPYQDQLAHDQNVLTAVTQIVEG